jgi:hypothetical protein
MGRRSLLDMRDFLNNSKNLSKSSKSSIVFFSCLSLCVSVVAPAPVHDLDFDGRDISNYPQLLLQDGGVFYS